MQESWIQKRAKRVQREIEADLDDRGGLGFGGVDTETQEEIRKAHLRIIERSLEDAYSLGGHNRGET